MKTESIKALDEAIFSLQGAKNKMEFHSSDVDALLWQENYMCALNTYLGCLDKCHKEAMPLANEIKHGSGIKAYDMLDELTGHKFIRIP